MAKEAILGGILLLIIIGIGIGIAISISSYFDETKEIEQSEKNKIEVQIKNLKAEFRKNPTFINGYEWNKLVDKYESKYKNNYDSNKVDKFLIDHVQNYKGKNNEGYVTLIDAIQFTFAFLSIANDENILDHPSTSIGWYVLGTPIRNNDIIEDHKSVIFTYKTYDDKIELEFWVNTITGDVTYGNKPARDMLSVVNTT